MTAEIEKKLRKYAAKYEESSFIKDDPSWFMHQVSGEYNKETVGFVASSISYGNRKQFMPKIQWIIDEAQGDVYNWINREFTKMLYQVMTKHAFIDYIQSILCTVFLRLFKICFQITEV